MITIIQKGAGIRLTQPTPATQKHTNFTQEYIKSYLGQLTRLIQTNKYIISRDPVARQENYEFIEDYKIDTVKEKEILLGLEYTDFCYAVDNEKSQFAHEKLYVFCKEHELDHWGTPETVHIYIKSNLTKTRKGDDFAIVISFHKLNKPITYLFRK